MKRYTIVSIGETVLPGADALGGDKSLLKHGLKFELVGPDPVDGGPTLLAACPDLATRHNASGTPCCWPTRNKPFQTAYKEIVVDDERRGRQLNRCTPGGTELNAGYCV